MSPRMVFILRSNRLAGLLLCVLTLAPITGWAERLFEPHVLIKKDHQTFVVKADGTYSQTMDEATQILTPQSAEKNGSIEISYIGSQEDILTVEAWTITPEGVRLDIAPSAIRDREEDNSNGSTEFSDSKMKVIVFPNVQVGSVTAYRLSSNVHVANYPGEFQRMTLFNPSIPYEDIQYQFVLPAEKKLYIDMRGVTGGYEKTENGLSYYTFRYSRKKVEAPATNSVSLIHYADYLAVSTIADMQALGAASKPFYESNVAVTDDIRELALRLTKDLNGEREKAKALYTWVAQNIRYVAIFMGDGRLVPHPASTVLINRYGDCKDHEVLLASLLAAVGIFSSPALINSGFAYRFLAIGSHYPLNHVITYIPSLNLYLDSTDRFAPFGTLPFGDLDKPVVLTALGTIGRTPPMRAQDHSNVVNVQMRIQPDGTIVGSSKARMKGFFENGSRSSRFSARSRSEESEVQDLLFRYNESGTGSLKYADPTDLSLPYFVEARFKLESLSNMPGRGALAVPVGLAPGEMTSLASVIPPKDDGFPARCASRSIEESYSLTFPRNVSIEEVPKGVRFKRGDIVYESRFTRLKKTVRVDRKLTVQRSSMICGERENNDWLAFYGVLRRDLRSQIIYR